MESPLLKRKERLLDGSPALEVPAAPAS